MRYLATCFIATTLLLAGTGCNKDNGGSSEPIVTTPEKYDFEPTGDTYVYSTVIFRSNLKKDSKLTWDFGDGKFANVLGTETKHTYNSAGTYLVSMTVDDDDSKIVQKSITITQGTQRLGGERNWNYLLKIYKTGQSLDLIPPSQFTLKAALQVPDDNTILIPDIPQLRYRGPYKVTLAQTTPDYMLFKSEDEQTTLTYLPGDHRASVKIVQVSPNADSSWHLDGTADIYN